MNYSVPRLALCILVGAGLLWTPAVAPSWAAVIPGAGPAHLALSAVQQEQKESKADQERRKQEEKAADAAAKTQKDRADWMDEIQPHVDALALTLRNSFYDDRFLQDYINEMGQGLVPKEAPPGLLFSFRVLDDATPNAISLPDGRIYVNSGLLAFVQNEAQLATVLGHEIAHVVEDHAYESKKENSSFKKRVLPGLLGAAIGATIGAAAKGKEGAAVGAAVGAVGGIVYTVISTNNYAKDQEAEADRLGTRWAMDNGYDPKEAVSFFELLSKTFGDRDRFSNFVYGDHARNDERARYVRTLLDSDLAASYNSLKSAGRLTAGSGGLRQYASRMFRDAAIRYMDEFDRWDIAKRLLDTIVDHRGSDPKTLWAIGRVFKMVGRTDRDRDQALDYLQRAAQLDERALYPFIYRDLGMMQARMGGPMLPAAVESLKQYVVRHVSRYDEYPPDLGEIYDYLLTFGDAKWTAPRVDRGVVRVVAPPSTPLPEAKEKPPAKTLPRVAPKK